MTLFPSAFRSERPPAMGAPVRLLDGLRNLLRRMLASGRRDAAPALSVVPTGVGTLRPERSEPRLRWTDPATAPDGNYAASAIANADLDITAVPRRGETWDAVSEFALTYDGYAYWDDLPTLAGRVLQRWTRRRSLPSSLDELRGCLFYEQRRWNHFGEDPTGRSAEYMWATIEAIGAVVTPVATTAGRVPDPRRTTAPETHVKLVAARAVSLRAVPAPPLAMRPLPARAGRLVPVSAAEAHVRLVSSIEDAMVGDAAFDDRAGAQSRHPSGYTTRRAWGHSAGIPAGNPAEHPARNGALRDLKPMPSAEPLPKPPVIVRRSRRSVPGAPNRPGGAVNSSRAPGDPWPSTGSRWKLEQAADASAAAVTPLCHEFFDDDPGYGTWIDTHPQGFVLHQPKAGRSRAPTLHRVGCPAVAPRGGTEARATGAVRVCGPSGDALRTWSLARGTAEPTPCRRCCP